jgi:hypothetical protein
MGTTTATAILPLLLRPDPDELGGFSAAPALDVVEEVVELVTPVVESGGDVTVVVNVLVELEGVVVVVDVELAVVDEVDDVV